MRPDRRETAEMPSFYQKGEYDLAVLPSAWWKKENHQRGGSSSGDQLIGLASSGLHSNGYSLRPEDLF